MRIHGRNEVEGGKGIRVRPIRVTLARSIVHRDPGWDMIPRQSFTTSICRGYQLAYRLDSTSRRLNCQKNCQKTNNIILLK